MKELFYRGGWQFMTMLTIILIITTVWIICHFIIAYHSKQAKQEKFLHRMGYGKIMGLFAIIVGVCGQMLGLYAMFDIVEVRTKLALELTTEVIMHSIKVTVIVTIYGILIYLFSILLCFIASKLIKKKLKNQDSV